MHGQSTVGLNEEKKLSKWRKRMKRISWQQHAQRDKIVHELLKIVINVKSNATEVEDGHKIF